MASDSRLKYRAEWIYVGWSLVALVIYLSVTSTPPQLDIEFKYLDKLEHLFAYAVLMGWFGQLYHTQKSRIGYLLGFIAMGIGLEIIQGVGGVRYFEYGDIAANSIGAAIGWGMSRGRGADLLKLFEHWVLPRRSSERD
ncbi:MAG: VanZ family protein [Gammaproteobacteria bacterium]|nr:VanZ family protein [Gammaproteobacteria bacterium]MCW8888595.1 VanZ family protein [Gammaproteobacteria bacterium]